jgi:transposase-like protein
MGKTVKKYTQEFRQESVRLALKSVNVDGVARELGIPGATLHG